MQRDANRKEATATNFSKELIVTPGSKAKLSKYDPEETLGCQKGHKMKSSLKKSIERLDAQQYLLYAEHKHALIMLQGLVKPITSAD